MDPRAMQIIGVCRFSYPAIGGFQVDHETVAARMAFLFDPARMEDRFRLFEAFTLPSLKAQTDPDFTLLVIIGDAMPEPWRGRLMELLAGLPQAVVDARKPGQHRGVMKDAINAQLRETGLPSLQFRMDDDDAVGVDFIERLRQTAGDCAGLLARHRHVALDFNQGHVAAIGPDGISARPLTEGMITAGLAISVQPGIGNTVLNFSHKKMWKRMPVIAQPDADMFLRGFSDFNDSRQQGAGRELPLTLLTPGEEAHFLRRFAVSADQVRAAFRRASLSR